MSKFGFAKHGRASKGIADAERAVDLGGPKPKSSKSSVSYGARLSGSKLCRRSNFSYDTFPRGRVSPFYGNTWPARTAIIRSRWRIKINKNTRDERLRVEPSTNVRLVLCAFS